MRFPELSGKFEFASTPQKCCNTDDPLHPVIVTGMLQRISFFNFVFFSLIEGKLICYSVCNIPGRCMHQCPSSSHSIHRGPPVRRVARDRKNFIFLPINYTSQML